MKCRLYPNCWQEWINPPRDVFGRKKPFKTNILKGVTAGVNLFAACKVLYFRELR